MRLCIVWHINNTWTAMMLLLVNPNPHRSLGIKKQRKNLGKPLAKVIVKTIYFFIWKIMENKNKIKKLAFITKYEWYLQQFHVSRFACRRPSLLRWSRGMQCVARWWGTGFPVFESSTPENWKCLIGMECNVVSLPFPVRHWQSRHKPSGLSRAFFSRSSWK